MILNAYTQETATLETRNYDKLARMILVLFHILASVSVWLLLVIKIN